MQGRNTGGTHCFRISYAFFKDPRETEIKFLINDDNILEFEREGQVLTTRWNLDDLARWLRLFIDNMKEDAYPVNVAGEYAAIKDINAREFESDDEEEFDAHYDKIDEWNLRHRWHTASNGAILADLYFQLVGENVEISWNNQDSEEGVIFKHELGGARIPREEFTSVVGSFLKAYADYWVC